MKTREKIKKIASLLILLLLSFLFGSEKNSNWIYHGETLMVCWRSLHTFNFRNDPNGETLMVCWRSLHTFNFRNGQKCLYKNIVGSPCQTLSKIFLKNYEKLPAQNVT